MDGLLPFNGTAPEGCGAVIDAPGDPDAEVVGCALALQAHHGLQIIRALYSPGTYKPFQLRISHFLGPVAVLTRPSGSALWG